MQDSKVLEEKARLAQAEENARYEKAQRRLGELVRLELFLKDSAWIQSSVKPSILGRIQFHITMHNLLHSSFRSTQHTSRLPEAYIRSSA